MSSKLYNVFMNQPKWAIGIEIAVLTIGGAYGAYKLVKFASDKLKIDKDKKEGKAASDEVVNLAQSGIKPSYPDAQYESWSQAIVAAIDGWGTDEDAINSVMSNMKNDADVYKLISVYSSRRYYGTLENFFGADSDGTNVSRSLTEALHSELDDSEIADINSMFSAKGIKYRF